MFCVVQQLLQHGARVKVTDASPLSLTAVGVFMTVITMATVLGMYRLVTYS